jgi:hypothetical protein
MNSVNRKILMTLLGVLLATPFLVIAAVVAAHVASVNHLRVDVLCVVLALAAIAARDGHVALLGRSERPQRESVKSKDHADLRGVSTVSPGY